MISREELLNKMENLFKDIESFANDCAQFKDPDYVDELKYNAVDYLASMVIETEEDDCPFCRDENANYFASVALEEHEGSIRAVLYLDDEIAALSDWVPILVEGDPSKKELAEVLESLAYVLKLQGGYNPSDG